ncbi:hypothetical protein ABQJ54_07015, partial [Rhodanobacter sp. Si-c]
PHNSPVHTVKDHFTAEPSARGHFVPVSRPFYIVLSGRQQSREDLISASCWGAVPMQQRGGEY